ncbi:hypothetical protein [Pseudoalteromonas sp. 20-MNA-CIBAN-0454]|uniref:hypothetical protein n=1 Tax=Pseudoalteromonas sp. 20-MNA-CIBAN-0454 TaxID=3140424 RepID=UPI00332D7A2C|tara:strand:- start:7261 stop:7653 length:393 start_codon:yes stop_codon:yes gene_type:complete
MNIELEKVGVKTAIEHCLTNSDASHFMINIVSSHPPLIEYLKAAFASESVHILACADSINMKHFFGVIRTELQEKSDVQLMIVSHELGWPIIESCHLNFNTVKAMSDQSAIYAGDNTIYHGQPFYDGDVF